MSALETQFTSSNNTSDKNNQDASTVKSSLSAFDSESSKEVGSRDAGRNFRVGGRER